MKSRRIAIVVLLAALVLIVFIQRNWNSFSIRFKGPGSGGKQEIVVGLIASKSGGSALAGESIERGLRIAIDEINARGGVNGNKLQLVVRDDEGEPSKGVIAARELIERQKVVAVFGGLHSPVSLAMMPVFEELKVPYVGTWAAATGITVNAQKPNYMFRVSARDDLVDQFLVNYCAKRLQKKKLGVIVENTPWGESNVKGLQSASAGGEVAVAGVEKFNWGDSDMTASLLRLQASGAECLVMVANAPEGASVMRSLAKIQWSVPVVSHWGISGGRFPELAGDQSGNVRFIQTYSFFQPPTAVSKRVFELLDAHYKIKSPEEVSAPVGTANAYDAMHLLALAIGTSKSVRGEDIRDALEKLGSHEGLIKKYDQPFSESNHDALSYGDYLMCQWSNNQILPETDKP